MGWELYGGDQDEREEEEYRRGAFEYIAWVIAVAVAVVAIAVAAVAVGAVLDGFNVIELCWDDGTDAWECNPGEERYDDGS
jgi:hypothetical protein